MISKKQLIAFMLSFFPFIAEGQVTLPCDLHPGAPEIDETEACTGNFSLSVPLLNANASQFAHAYEANDWSGMGEVAWDQFVPVPLSSPWEWERAYTDNISMARTSEQRVIGALMTPYSMIGRSKSGIGSLVATGAEVAFGWTAPSRSKAQGVWSPWRESQY